MVCIHNVIRWVINMMLHNVMIATYEKKCELLFKMLMVYVNEIMWIYEAKNVNPYV